MGVGVLRSKREHLETGCARAGEVGVIQPLQRGAMPAFDFPFCRAYRPIRP